MPSLSSIRKIGGTHDNPILAAIIDLKNLPQRIEFNLRRGRKISVQLKKEDTHLTVETYFSNNHRSRGWTLELLTSLLDGNKVVSQIEHQRGLPPRLWRSLRKAKSKSEIKLSGPFGLETVKIMLVARRDSSKRFVPEIFEEIDPKLAEVLESII